MSTDKVIKPIKKTATEKTIARLKARRIRLLGEVATIDQMLFAVDPLGAPARTPWPSINPIPWQQLPHAPPQPVWPWPPLSPDHSPLLPNFAPALPFGHTLICAAGGQNQPMQTTLVSHQDHVDSPLH
jgi:hypothetical protein